MPATNLEIAIQAMTPCFEARLDPNLTFEDFFECFEDVSVSGAQVALNYGGEMVFLPTLSAMCLVYEEEQQQEKDIWQLIDYSHDSSASEVNSAISRDFNEVFSDNGDESYASFQPKSLPIVKTVKHYQFMEQDPPYERDLLC